MEIPLSKIYPVEKPEKYKMHLACWNGTDQPLDVFVRDRPEWDEWNAWRGRRDDFNREFVFALIDFYPEKHKWLFGGVYRVLSKDASGYLSELVDESKPFVGRLKIAFRRPSRNRAVNFENYYHRLVASEILPEPYTGESFCGYDLIDLQFSMLESIFTIQRKDWKAALENAKGVYLITDTSNGKRYVGSAYGGTGIWSRWGVYVGTGHGYNDELTRVISENGLDYARRNFRFALLEHRAMKTEDNVIIQREKYWKDVLLSRGDYGYNKN